jgi:hypothetical protein
MISHRARRPLGVIEATLAAAPEGRSAPRAALESPPDGGHANVTGAPGGARAPSPLLLIIAAGVAIRLLFGFFTEGSAFDIGSLKLVDEALREDPLDVYGNVNVELHDAGVEFVNYRWPYPPAFFPWLLGTTSLEARTGISFHVLIELPAIAADAVLAWLAYRYAALRDASERTRLAAAAVVALGPVFIAISGHHGQIDSLAILPAVYALIVWERRDSSRGALAAGLLIGLGGALKTTPLLMLFALLPTARSRGEGLRLAGAALAVPAAMMLPFAIADPDGVASLADYSGAPGLGGLSLLVQPGLVGDWLVDVTRTLSGPSRELFDHGSLLTGAALLAAAATLMRFRAPPRVAAVVLWLTLWVFGAGFFFQYLIWGLPFIVLCGWIRAAAALQAAVLVPMLLFYFRPWDERWLEYVYIPIMVAVWLAMVVALARLVRGVATRAYAAR